MRAESPAVLGFQVLMDQCGKVGQVRPLQAAEEVPEPVRIQDLCLEVVEPPVRYALNVLIFAERLIEEGLVAYCLWIELGGVGGLSSFDQPAVVEVRS